MQSIRAYRHHVRELLYRILTYLSPLLAQRKFAELMFDDDTQASDQKARTQGLLEYFQRQCLNFESRLTSVFHSRERGR